MDPPNTPPRSDPDELAKRMVLTVGVLGCSFAGIALAVPRGAAWGAQVVGVFAAAIAFALISLPIGVGVGFLLRSLTDSPRLIWGGTALGLLLGGLVALSVGAGVAAVMHLVVTFFVFTIGGCVSGALVGVVLAILWNSKDPREVRRDGRHQDRREFRSEDHREVWDEDLREVRVDEGRDVAYLLVFPIVGLLVGAASGVVFGLPTHVDTSRFTDFISMVAALAAGIAGAGGGLGVGFLLAIFLNGVFIALCEGRSGFLRLLVAPLPANYRERYKEEWLSDIKNLKDRGQPRLRFSLSLLRAAVALAIILRWPVVQRLRRK